MTPKIDDTLFSPKEDLKLAKTKPVSILKKVSSKSKEPRGWRPTGKKIADTSKSVEARGKSGEKENVRRANEASRSGQNED